MDWREVDERLGVEGYEDKAYSYKYFKEVVTGKYLDQWTAREKQEVDQLMAQLMGERRAQLAQLTQEAMIQARSEVMEAVSTQLNLKKQPKSFKKIQDHMRQFFNKLYAQQGFGSIETK